MVEEYRRYLTTAPETERLSAPPVQIWVIGVVEVCVKYGDRQYLLVQLASYSLRNQQARPHHEEGYWAPPFVAYPVPLTFSPPSTLGSLLRQCQTVQDASVREGIEQLCYRLGFRDVQLESRPGFVEVKRSPRSPDLVKAYIFRRFGLVSLSEDCLNNLSDSEGLLGLTYMPIRATSSTPFQTVSSSAHGRTEVWFRGKPIQSNLEAVMTEEGWRSEIAAKSIELKISDFSSNDEGVIIACDVSRYGVAQESTRTMASILGSAADAGFLFGTEVAEILHGFASEIGTMHIQTAGDGLVLGVPLRHGPGISEIVARVITAWRNATRLLDQLSQRAHRADFSLGSRLALHGGNYRFGRIAGPESVVAGFEGQEVVRTVRYEQGLATYCKAAGMASGAHAVALTGYVRPFLDVNLMPSYLRAIARDVELASKEFWGRASVFLMEDEEE